MVLDENIWVVIPAYNEKNKIGEVVAKVRQFCKNIVVVDDGSSDNTEAIAGRENAFVLKHFVNLGKGAALKTGCDFAYRRGASKLILMDADGQHEPEEIPFFLRKLEDFSVVFGYRKFNKTMPLVFKLGNSFITLITQLLYGLKVRDTQSGYRGLTREAYRKLRWKASDYFVESEMIANVGKSKLSYVEIPIKTIYADKYKGTTILDGIKIILNMFMWRLK